MQQIIDISTPDDGLGDALRVGFDKVNQNTTELYNGKVDKVTGKGLSENDFTDAYQTKLDGIEPSAQVNVNADFGETNPVAPGYILNKPPSLYSAAGHFHYADDATQTTPLVVLPSVPKKLTNDTLGVFTNLAFAPYGVSSVWDIVNNEFDFSSLSLGDSLLIRTDLFIDTTSINQTISIYIKLGIGTASEYDLQIDNFNVKAITTDLHILKDVSLSIDNSDWKDYPAVIYILSDDDATVKVNGWYIPIIRKSVNLVGIAAVENTDYLGEGSSNLYFEETRVRSTLLTGLTPANGTFSASSSILTAFGRLKYLIDNISAVVISALGYTPANNTEVLSNDETTYTAATLPLAGTEFALVEQGGTFKKVAVSEFYTEKLITNASVTGSYAIDWTNDVWDLTLTGNTTLTESNLPASGKTKTITLNVSGNFTLSYPADWTDFITGAYSGTATLNTITIQYFGTGKYKVLIVQPD